MLSQKARYALRALFVLAHRPAGRPVMIAEVAGEAKVPRKFLEQILLDLKKRGLVHSTRGKFGGYTLGRPAEEISFAEVIRVIDGPLALTPCSSQTAYRRCDDCTDETTCTIRKAMLQVRAATVDILERLNVGETVHGLPPAQPPRTVRTRPARGAQERA